MWLNWDYLGLAFRMCRWPRSDRGSWRISVGGPNVIGTITLPSARDRRPWNLQFDRLRSMSRTLAASERGEPRGEPGAAPDAMALPTAQHTGDQISRDRTHLGRTPVRRYDRDTGKIDDGVALKQLTVTGPNLNVSAHGDWRGKNEGIGRIQGTLASTDVQSTLKELGYAMSFRPGLESSISTSIGSAPDRRGVVRSRSRPAVA